MSVSIILGDIHLGKGLSIGKLGIGSALNSRIVDQINLLDWVRDQAHQRHAERIILTGDIFQDPKPHPSIIKIFLAWVKRCQLDNIQLHIIYGNHDILRSGQFVTSALDILAEADLDNVFLYNSIDTIITPGVGFTLLPFRDRRSFDLESHDKAILSIKDKLTFERASIPSHYKKVLIGHLALEGSIYVGDEFSDSSNELFCPLDMFNDYDYVWMGHIHKPQVLKESPHIAHVGSMDRSDFGETDHDKVIIVLDSDSPEFFETVQLPTRNLVSLKITIDQNSADPTQTVLDQLKLNSFMLKDSLMRLEVQVMESGLPNLDRKLIESQIYKYGTFHISGFTETRKVQQIKKRSTDQFTNINDASVMLKRYAELHIEPDIHDEFCSVATEVMMEYKAEEK